MDTYYNDVHYWCESAKVEDLKGKTLTSIENDKNYQLIFHTEEGKKYIMLHEQECCEHVRIEDIIGDLDDLVGSPITMAEESSNWKNLAEEGDDEDRSTTWTFYKFATNKGYVTIRWLGESTGWYSEKVSFGVLDREIKNLTN